MTHVSKLPFLAPSRLGLHDAAVARIGRVLDDQVERARLPGYVAMVGRRGHVGWLGVGGVQDPATGAAMASDSIFRIYSMTKPLVSMAVMMLLEEGRLLLSDPVASLLPEFTDVQVGVERDGELELVAPGRPMTVQDLLRHTSGLTYEFTGEGLVNKLYGSANLANRMQTNDENCRALARLPLLVSPGVRWEYSRATDVLGRVVEVISGQSLGGFLKERVFEPLAMTDTAFWVPPAKHARIAEPLAKDPDTGDAVRLMDVRKNVAFESGGGGLVSTVHDYANFVQMVMDGGTFGGERLIGRKTLEYMAADALGDIPSHSPLLPAGYGFGLGFAVRRADGIAADSIGSAGMFHWSGIAGTTFWIDPREQLFAILMVQAPGQRESLRPMFRNLVYSALAD